MALMPNFVPNIRRNLVKPTFWIFILLLINLFYLRSLSDRIGRDNPERQKALNEVQSKSPELATGLYSAVERNGSGNVECIDKDDFYSLESNVSDIKQILEGRTLFPR